MLINEWTVWATVTHQFPTQNLGGAGGDKEARGWGHFQGLSRLPSNPSETFHHHCCFRSFEVKAEEILPPFGPNLLQNSGICMLSFTVFDLRSCVYGVLKQRLNHLKSSEVQNTCNVFLTPLEMGTAVIWGILSLPPGVAWLRTGAASREGGGESLLQPSSLFLNSSFVSLHWGLSKFSFKQRSLVSRGHTISRGSSLLFLFLPDVWRGEEVLQPTLLA